MLFRSVDVPCGSFHSYVPAQNIVFKANWSTRASRVVAIRFALIACYEVCGPNHPLAGRFFVAAMGSEGMRIDAAARKSFRDAMERRLQRCRMETRLPGRIPAAS